MKNERSRKDERRQARKAKSFMNEISFKEERSNQYGVSHAQERKAMRYADPLDHDSDSRY